MSTNQRTMKTENKLEYFGTEITSKGHFLYVLGESFNRSLRRIEDLPFNPEGLPYKEYKVGGAQFHVFCGFSIYAICGSPSDTRPGSKSIFFTEQILTESEMIKLIGSTPIALKVYNIIALNRF